jgi:hypothetical protein
MDASTPWTPTSATSPRVPISSNVSYSEVHRVLRVQTGKQSATASPSRTGSGPASALRTAR